MSKIRLIIAVSKSCAAPPDEVSAAVAAALQRWGLPDGPFGDVVDEVICAVGDRGDPAGAAWAASFSIPVRKEPVTREDIAAWGNFYAGRHRNRRMAMRGTHIVALWDGFSDNTPDLVARMVGRDKPAFITYAEPRRGRRG